MPVRWYLRRRKSLVCSPSIQFSTSSRNSSASSILRHLSQSLRFTESRSNVQTLWRTISGNTLTTALCKYIITAAQEARSWEQWQSSSATIVIVITTALCPIVLQHTCTIVHSMPNTRRHQGKSKTPASIVTRKQWTALTAMAGCQLQYPRHWKPSPSRSSTAWCTSVTAQSTSPQMFLSL